MCVSGAPGQKAGNRGGVYGAVMVLKTWMWVGTGRAHQSNRGMGPRLWPCLQSAERLINQIDEQGSDDTCHRSQNPQPIPDR